MKSLKMRIYVLCFFFLLWKPHTALSSCPSDLDGSGWVEVDDVLSLLSDFGCDLDCGGADLNEDGVVNVIDVLIALGEFGQNCQSSTPSVWANATFDVLFEDNVVFGLGLSHDGWGGPTLDTVSLELDVYLPDNQQASRPAMMIVHGGGFFGGSNEQQSLVNLSYEYASRGWVVFSINYRLAGQRGSVPNAWLNALNLIPAGQNTDQVLAMYPANRDAKAALRWIASHANQYDIDVNHISVLGGSAGAFISVALGSCEAEDYTGELSVIQDPTLESTNMSQEVQVATVLNFWGGRASVDVLTALDGVSRFDVNDAPLMIVHGTNDATVNYSEALSLNATYLANGNICTLHTIPGGGHGIWSANVDGLPLWSVGFDFMVQHQGLTIEP